MTTKTLPLQIPCEDFHDYLKKCETFKRRHWGFRGHGNRGKHWKLESKLIRFLQDHVSSVKTAWWPARERASLARFQTGAHLHLNHLPLDAQPLSWLAIMQHYGSPTRMLDFSFSPAVGFFFAIHDATNEDAFSIQAVHLKTVMANCYSKIKKKCDNSQAADYYIPTNEDYRIGGKNPEEFVGVVNTRFSSPRQQAQEGLFLVPSRIDLDVEEWLRSCEPDAEDAHWVEFTFPRGKSFYKNMVRQFLQISLSPSGLFPGLEGLAQASKYSWFDVSKDYFPL